MRGTQQPAPRRGISSERFLGYAETEAALTNNVIPSEVIARYQLGLVSRVPCNPAAVRPTLRSNLGLTSLSVAKAGWKFLLFYLTYLA